MNMFLRDGDKKSDTNTGSGFMNIGPGSWTLTSKSNPKWNKEGRAEVITFTGGRCKEATQYIESKKKELGTPPKDLSYSCMKD